MNLDNNPQSIFDLDERETSVNSKPSSRPGLDILGKLSHPMSSASILGNLCLRSQKVWGECANLFPGVWQYECWLAAPDRGLSSETEESSWNLFQQRTSPGWKVWCRRLLYPESLLWKDCLARAWLFLMEAVRSLKYWSISPFISCGSKEAGLGSLGSLWLFPRVRVYEVSKRWTWNLEGPMAVLLARVFEGSLWLPTEI